MAYNPMIDEDDDEQLAWPREPLHGVFGKANPDRYKPGMTMNDMAHQDAVEEINRWQKLRDKNRAGRSEAENVMRDIGGMTSPTARKAYMEGMRLSQANAQRAAEIEMAKYNAEAAQQKYDTQLAGAQIRAEGGIKREQQRGQNQQQQLQQQNEFKAQEAAKERAAKAAEAAKERAGRAAEAEKDRAAKAALQQQGQDFAKWQTEFNSTSADRRQAAELAMKKQIADARNSQNGRAQIVGMIRAMLSQPGAAVGNGEDYRKRIMETLGITEDEYREALGK